MTMNCEISFEPNLNFTSNLTGELKTNYFEKYENAKQLMDNYKHFMEDVLQRMTFFGKEWSKMYTEKIETDVKNKKLQMEIDSLKAIRPTYNPREKPSSEILGASPNCNIKTIPKISTTLKSKHQSDDDNLIAQKENIEQFIPIYSCDFESDMEDNFGKLISPTKSVAKSSDKTENSPILSKRKKNKRNTPGSNASSPSVNSGNDSKLSSCKLSLIEKMDEMNDFEKEPKITFEKEPLKILENTYFAPAHTSQNEEKLDCKFLSVSKMNCANTEFGEGRKKMRQTTLSLKPVVPVIDISKVDSNETFSKRVKLNNSDESHKFKDKSLEDEVDLVETSPAQRDSSKLRNKLTLKGLSNTRKIKVKNAKEINDEAIEKTQSLTINNNSKAKHNDAIKNDLLMAQNLKTTLKPSKLDDNLFNDKKLMKSQKGFISDETYFSPAEIGTSNNNTNDFDIDASDFQDEMECTSPPTKKKLLNSFDVIPGRERESPMFAYKETPVRNKNERAQLPGWGCRDCEKWYGHLPEEEKKLRKNKCSKHRGNFKRDIQTPESFWNPDFGDSADSSND